MVTCLGSIAQLCFGAGHCKQTLLACAGSARSVAHPEFSPARGAVCFPGLHCSGPQCFSGVLSQVCPGFHALPRSQQLRGPGAWCAHCPRGAAHLHHLPVLAAPCPGCAVRARSQVCRGLLWGADLRLRASWRMSTIQHPRRTWLATGISSQFGGRCPLSG